MIKKIYHTWLFLLLLIILSNCKQHANCFEGFKELNLHPVSTTFKLPPFIIKDSVIYGDTSKILSYKIKSIDSTFSMYVFIDNHEKTPRGSLDLDHIAEVQKAEVESGQNSKKIIKEEYKNNGKIKVGYVKYFVEQGNRKFYAGRIFFYREQKLVVCWLFEDYINELNNKHSTIDCVFENIVIR